jgi:hypothetical protein
MAGLWNDAAALENLSLEPDGKYQTRTFTLRELNAEVAEALQRSLRDRTAADLPVFICSWGKCRTGSTALTNLFGIAGIPSYYQPVKTTARHRFLGDDPPPWVPPPASEHPLIHAKEMAGPYLPVETIFNPLQMLLEAGYPASRLRLVVLDREPLASLASWFAKFGAKRPRATLLEHFVLSSLQARRMKSWAKANGVPFTHYVYELTQRPADAIEAHFRAIGASAFYRPGLVDNWDERGALESEHSLVIFPQEPAPYIVPGLHSSEKQYAFKHRDASDVTAEEREVVRRYGLFELYDESVEACIDDLGISDEFASSVFGRPGAHDAA